ncbi:NACHT, LRR and PYD domains-containing protein 3-like [Engraulis encrasicolus]|uniref:NACHT, LRR and PYD domains-containing protein 3-like n=1 Tax=Engraulis encrasicolus TaxID=184585 RepID=UPI002FCF4CA2
MEEFVSEGRPPSPAPSCVSMKSDASKDPTGINFKGPDSSLQQMEEFVSEGRPPSPAPSCVSMKSDRSMPCFINFKGPDTSPQQMEETVSEGRPPSPAPTCVSMKSDRSMDRDINFKGPDSSPQQMEESVSEGRPPSPAPTCVSMKSDWSMDRDINFKGPDSSLQQMEEFVSEGRPPSPAPTCVSMKSDRSMPRIINFKGPDSLPQQMEESVSEGRPPSPAPTCVSIKSDRSMDRDINFKGPDSSPKQMEESVSEGRPPSPAPSCVSMKSDQSKASGINFKGPDSSPKQMEQSVSEGRSPSPAPTCVSMKSDQSKASGINFKGPDSSPQQFMPQRSLSSAQSSVSLRSDRSKDGALPHFREDPMSSSQGKPKKGTSVQHEQESLTHVFQVIEKKINTFVKNELQRFKMILSPDYQEDLNRKDEDESDARDGALKMALHFLWEMERTDLVDKLKEHELDVLCRAELKRHLKNKYQSVFEGIPIQGNSALLDKIYTDIYITEGGTGKVNDEHEVRQIESISKRSVRSKKQMKCNDIFKLLPGQDMPSRRVITMGVAGIGKTISIQKYILDWAEGKDNREIHFIFPLPFRELNLMRGTQFSLMGLLHHFFPDLKQLTIDSQEKYNLLFIFDGLDECRLQLNFQENESWTDVTGVTSLDVLLTNLIKGNLLPSALLWITSRPAAASQIPPDCVDLVTEIQGFDDTQKEEYFRNRFNDESFVSTIMSHIKSSRSLHIMCHIPVFCWITAYVLVVILGSSEKRQLPKTLTEMYTYFLIFQTKQANQKFGNVHDLDRQWNKNLILDLGKLAYKQLEKGNVIFYEDDLRECGIDIKEAAVFSGVCTQIFRQESAISQATVFCFIHLSIHEYLAALYVFLRMARKRENVISKHQRWEQLFGIESMTTVHKNAVDKALEYEDGRFDLFLRFLLGLSLESNQTLLHGLLQSGERHIGNAETISYIKDKIRELPSSERVINLFHCLNELKDHSLVEEIQSFLRAGTLSEARLSPGQWAALVFVLLTSDQKLDVFDLKEYARSDEGLQRLKPVVEESNTLILADCGITGVGYAALASALKSNPSHLEELDLRGNDPGDSGVKLLLELQQDPACKLQTLRLVNCRITEEGCAALTSSLTSNPSHLMTLTLEKNKLRDSGVKQISALLRNPNCKLQVLGLKGCSMTEEGCASLASALATNPSHLTRLSLSDNKLGDSGVKQISTLLRNPDCKLQSLGLKDCSITEEGCAALTSALISNPSHLTELYLNKNKLGDSGVKQISTLLRMPDCKLQMLMLQSCSITAEGCAALTSALRSNPSHLRELSLSYNEVGDSGVKQISALLRNPDCKLQKLCLEDTGK